MVRKLACLFYRLIKQGQPYVDKDADYYKERYREPQVRSVIQRARQLGLQVIEPEIKTA